MSNIFRLIRVLCDLTRTYPRCFPFEWEGGAGSFFSCFLVLGMSLTPEWPIIQGDFLSLLWPIEERVSAPLPCYSSGVRPAPVEEENKEGANLE